MKFYEICFSPTRGTEKVSGFLMKELSKEYTTVDLTDTDTDFNNISLSQDDIALIAVPSFGGRVPVPAGKRLSQIKANGAKAILVCVYGNRAYEDTLAELQDIASEAGFSTIAAIAAIAEHSIAHKYATGRPDATDYQSLKAFADKIKAKTDGNDRSTPYIPGNRPYRKAGEAGIIPKPTKKCTKCGLCAKLCPVGAIDKNNPAKVDKKSCISCMRCVSVCPTKARKINGIVQTIVNMMLKKPCSMRKECELFI